MREHPSEFGGVVTAATSFGVPVTLDAMYVEGPVHTPNWAVIPAFDEARQELRGERSGMRYAHQAARAGQPCGPDGRKIDSVHEGEDKAGLVSCAMKDKSGGSEQNSSRRSVATARREGARGQCPEPVGRTTGQPHSQPFGRGDS
jgi:ribonuclease R